MSMANHDRKINIHIHAYYTLVHTLKIINIAFVCDSKKLVRVEISFIMHNFFLSYVY